MWWRKKQLESLGGYGERMAQEEYLKKGYKIIGRNIFNRKGKQFGEIDFIACNAEEICFVEVKTRTQGESRFGSGLEAIDRYKQKKILKAVKIFLLQNPQYQTLRPQIDACLIEVSALDKSQVYVTILSNAVEDTF